MNSEYKSHPPYIIRTDTITEAYKSLEKVDETLDLVSDDIYQWKWVIIALHNCVQCFMVLALEGTNQADVIKDETKDKRKVAEYLHPQNEWKPELAKLDYFGSLYEKIKSLDNSSGLDSSHDIAIDVLARHRNDFIHFFPKGLSIFVEDLPRVLQDIMDIISYLLFFSGKIEYKFSLEQVEVMRNHISSICLKLSVASESMKDGRIDVEESKNDL